MRMKGYQKNPSSWAGPATQLEPVAPTDVFGIAEQWLPQGAHPAGGRPQGSDLYRLAGDAYTRILDGECAALAAPRIPTRCIAPCSFGPRHREPS